MNTSRQKFLECIRDSNFSVTELKDIDQQARTRLVTHASLSQDPATVNDDKLKQQVAEFLAQTNQEISLINNMINFVQQNPPAGPTIYELGLQIILDIVGYITESNNTNRDSTDESDEN
ncbi:unnamed protein product [Adineta steineri]|uniref:Uncharacterized protein n=1 Tax=Adineta steineri TaxID=433720 RepID=A0A813NLR0_9BILA|nr:unnamed protein product [Adineta steineri]CAF3798685.1 unnamed protein product [Adineta steineri]